MPETAGTSDVVASGVFAAIPTMLVQIIRALVDAPDQITVESVLKGDLTVLILTVAPDDIGKVIGKQGRTARSLRTVINAAAPHPHRFELDIQADARKSL